MHVQLKVDRRIEKPLQAQLVEQLQAMIVAGQLKPGTRMMATRLMAEQFQLSRMTVLLAYEQLIAEGYLETRPPVGTFVSENPPCRPSREEAPRQRDARACPVDHAGIFHRHRAPSACGAPAEIDFRLSCSGGQLFPRRAWRQRLVDVLENHDFAREGHAPGGLEPLRRAVAHWLADNRAVDASPDEVIIVAGWQQAYDMLARLLVRAGDRVVVESPGRPSAAMAFAANGAELVSVPVDASGMDPERLPGGRAALVHVTPSHQFPLGGTLPVERRHAILHWAKRHGTYILEDDCDGEFRYNGASPPALKSLDRDGLVIYLGTFVNTLSPALRLAYLVVPAPLVDRLLGLKMLVDNGNAWLGQMALARFIEDGGYLHHLHRIRKTYMARRDCLVEALQRHFGDPCLIGQDAGTHLTWLVPGDDISPRAVQERALARGVGVQIPPAPGPGAAAGALEERAVLLGYAALPEPQLRAGVAHLAAVVGELSAEAGKSAATIAAE